MSARVFVHPRARRLAGELVSALEASGVEIALGDIEGDDAVWTRDYTPMRPRDGRAPPVAFAPQGERAQWLRGMGARVVDLPLRAGQLFETDERLFVAAGVLDEAGRALLGAAFGRPTSEVAELEPLPAERTGALDAFLSSLPGGEVVVPELDQSAFDAIGLVHEVALGRLVQTALDVRASDVAPADRSLRLPMVPPLDLERADDRPESWLGVTYSPTQGVWWTAGDMKVCVLPTFDASRFPEPYRQTRAEYESAWRSAFEERGYEVLFCDAEPAVREGGSLRRLIGFAPD
jgi:hypothetical protein